jgi:hypothetical protein
MTIYVERNVIGAKLTGYIKREKLEAFLENRFPRSKYPSAGANRFRLKVPHTWFKSLGRY